MTAASVLCGFVLALMGHRLGLLGLLIVSIFVAVRIAQVVRYGQGKRRFGITTALLGVTTFSCASYIASLYQPGIPGEYVRELAVMNDLRQIAAAEAVYARDHQLFGTLAELRDPRGDHFHIAPAYSLVLRPGPMEMQMPNQFYALAVPNHYRRHGATPEWVFLIPGSSLIKNRLIDGPAGIPWATSTFMVDESGVVRFADLNSRTSVNRTEAEKWARR